LAGDLPVLDGELAVEEVDLAQAAIDHGLLSGRQRLGGLLASQALPRVPH
jgi:hypothetical protein